MDSAVAAVLVHRAIGDRLTNIFVDNGLLRKNEFRETLELLRERMGLQVDGRGRGETLSGASKRGDGPGRQTQADRRGIYRRVR